MKIYKVVSKSKDGHQIEVILTDGHQYLTKHIIKQANTWKFFDYMDSKGRKFYKTITL